MTATIQELGIDKMSREDRLALAEAIWESIEQEEAEEPIPEWQRIELERRLADSIARPEAFVPWEVVKAKALARAKR